MSNPIDAACCLNLLKDLKGELCDLKNTLFYKEEEVRNLKVEIEKKQKSINTLNIKIINNCDHEWENDFVDSMMPYKLSQPIRYCIKCELTDCTTGETPQR